MNDWHIAARRLCTALAVFISACASTPVADWQIASANALRQGVDAFLSGLDKVAQVEFDRAQRETRRSGDPDLIARTDLLRCAAQLAALEFADCSQAAGLADATASTQAYARHLMATASAADWPLLPEAQRGVARHHSAPAQAAAIKDIDAAWSRLVAAGVLWRRGQGSAEVAEIAVQTASAQGWSRALAVWLRAWKSALEQAGQTEAAALAQRRLDLLLTPPAAATPPN